MSASETSEIPEDEHRLAWLGIPGPQPATIWVDASGALPALRFDVPMGASTVNALRKRELPQLDLDVPVLAVQLKYDEPWAPATVVSVFAELEPPFPDWAAPAGWSSVPVAEAVDLADALHPGLRARYRRWLEEVDGAPIHPLVPPWARPGWFTRASEWVVAHVGATAPDAVPVDIEQGRTWGISIVLQATAADGERYWFKGVCEHFGREVGVTRELDAIAPGFVAPVIAADVDERWLLLGHLADAEGTGIATSHAGAYRRLRALQDAVAGDHQRLIDAGVAVRPLADVPAAFAEVLADPALAEWHSVTPERAEQLLAWVAAAVDQVDALGLPEVLVHGDFHPGNVATLADGTRAIFDWSDAAIALPFVDVPTWLTWLEDDEAERVRVWESFAAAWADTLAPAEWLRRRPVLEAVAGAYHVASYAGIVRAMDPDRAGEHGVGIGEFLAFVEASLPT